MYVQLLCYQGSDGFGVAAVEDLGNEVFALVQLFILGVVSTFNSLGLFWHSINELRILTQLIDV